MPTLNSFLASTDPQSFKQAMNSAENEDWMEAMVKEMGSLIDKYVFELVPLRKGTRAIGCQWHYCTKYNTNKSIEKRDARLVSEGFLQRKGVHYDVTYAPSTKHDTICMVMTHMVLMGWES